METIKELGARVLEHLQTELSALRTGRATPSLVENLLVDVYGSKSKMIEIASITTPEPQSLVIQPWDTNNLKAIEKSISDSSLELQPINDGQVIRLIMPPLTEERRRDLTKIVGQKGEEAKIGIRNLREKEMKTIKSKQTDGSLSEDDSKMQQKEIQKSVDEMIAAIESSVSAKEQELQQSS